MNTFFTTPKLLLELGPKIQYSYTLKKKIYIIINIEKSL